ncbi:hypothetical protein NDU88_000786 [Pleurodeles waltl]|uniref:Uncharacterized protein n=1 Tax=Pleurodeles waltl TaxID=8319 RepID=A0AAV7MKP6_PLEWA|nr:hypothetical protein NDU88_000786 [Pleurodeles waltl]
MLPAWEEGTGGLAFTNRELQWGWRPAWARMHLRHCALARVCVGGRLGAKAPATVNQVVSFPILFKVQMKIEVLWKKTAQDQRKGGARAGEEKQDRNEEREGARPEREEGTCRKEDVGPKRRPQKSLPRGESGDPTEEESLPDRPATFLEEHG